MYLIVSQAIVLFLNKKENSKIAKSALDSKKREVLGNICEFLVMPHAAQELLSGKYTPTLCQVIPAYKELLQSLQELCLAKIEQDKPQIEHAIAASIKKIEDYVFKARKNCIYAIAMGKCHIILNLDVVYDWNLFLKL